MSKLLNSKMRIGIIKNYLKILVMNSITCKIPIQQDEDTGNEFKILILTAVV